MKIIGLLPKVRGSHILDQFFSMFLKHNCFIFFVYSGHFFGQGGHKITCCKGGCENFFRVARKKTFFMSRKILDGRFFQVHKSMF